MSIRTLSNQVEVCIFDGEYTYYIAGMMRGLAFAVDGPCAIDGITNELFEVGEVVIWTFSSPSKARTFCRLTNRFLGDEVEIRQLRWTR